MYIYKEKNNVLFEGYVKYILHHEPDHTFHTPTQTLKYTRKNIHTQKNIGTGSKGQFYNILKIYIWL